MSTLSQCFELCGAVKQKNINLNILELCYCFSQIWLSNVQKLYKQVFHLLQVDGE